ncbi:MAG: hypothetical protein ACRELC_02305 [Gemmatimonadota bacterium]
MAMRSLSGIVFTRGVRRGIATIRFNPHDGVSVDPATVGETVSVGPTRDFVATPCKHVAIRQFTLPGDSGGLASTRGLVIDDEVDTERLVIRWDSEGPAFVSEISYLVVGQTSDA